MAPLAALLIRPLTLSLTLTQDDINLVDESISNLLLEALSTGAPPAPRPMARPHRKTAWHLPLDSTHPLLAASLPTYRHASPYPRLRLGQPRARGPLCALPLQASNETPYTMLRMHVLHPPPHPPPPPPPPPPPHTHTHTPHVTCAAMSAPQHLISYPNTLTLTL